MAWKLKKEFHQKIMRDHTLLEAGSVVQTIEADLEFMFDKIKDERENLIGTPMKAVQTAVVDEIAQDQEKVKQEIMAKNAKVAAAAKKGLKAKPVEKVEAEAEQADA